jgi:UDP-N-acetylmuramoylalanine--D-glutamate ligase
MVAVMTIADDKHPPAPLNERPLPEAYTLIVGLGASGLAAARYLERRGEAVLVIDSRAEPPGLSDLNRDCPTAAVRTQTLDSQWLAQAGRLVLSPGLSVDLPIVAEARRRGLEVVGELELFARAVERPVVAVTGSNGKSTVTSLTAHLLAAQGFSVAAGGNLGPPAIDLLARQADDEIDVYVLEVSSFQLETTHSLKPVAAALLNISPDHIDRHGSLERYAALKAELLNAGEYAVVNLDDPLVRELAPAGAKTIPFSVAGPLADGWSIIGHAGERWLADRLEPLIPAAALRLAGETGAANALAALALVECLGGRRDAAIAALPGFSGLPHRLSHVLDVGGVRYVDDSKGTNVGATVAAIRGTATPLVLIAGGQSKGADFAPLAAVVRERVRAAVLLGEAADELERLLAAAVPVTRVGSMPEAVAAAARQAQPGDTVLLSPTCASQDMFRDYRERGEIFAAAVRELGR